MKIKKINKENQHEIGFDIECLPKWHNYIFKTPYDIWFSFSDVLLKDIETIEDLYELYLEGMDEFLKINFNYIPTKFEGGWENSLMKIERNSEYDSNFQVN